MGIVIQNLTFCYEDKLVLDNINLVINSGEMVGIVGVSGGGKSTLLKLISGLYDVKYGKIVINNESDYVKRRKNVAMVMQSDMLFPTSIRDNITCGHSMEEDLIKYACDVAQLSDWVSSLPDGLNTFVGERGSKVSGGQSQRIAIARAVAKDAPVILLDEPTSALDSNTSRVLMGALDRLTKGKTVIHVSHNPKTLLNCNRILRLDGGRLYDS